MNSGGNFTKCLSLFAFDLYTIQAWVKYNLRVVSRTVKVKFQLFFPIKIVGKPAPNLIGIFNAGL